MNVRDVATELMSIYRSIEEKCGRIADALGVDSSSFADEELTRLEKQIAVITGAQARYDEYYSQLVALGAPRVGWCCLEDLDNVLHGLHFDDELEKETDSVEQAVDWLLRYAKGELYTVDAEMVEAFWEECGRENYPPMRPQTCRT